MAIVVPKSSDPWPKKAASFRVDYFDTESGSASKAYFADEAEASDFADDRLGRGRLPCVVESRFMPVTHEVWSLAVDTDYVRSIQRFGNIETATLAFNVGKVHARKSGGRYQLREVGNTKPLAEYGRSAD